jgi:hypothetical protein
MHRFVAVFALAAVGSLSLAACQVRHADDQPPPAAPTAAAPPAPPPCTAMGLWNFQGPNGSADQVEIRQGDTPTSYVIHHTNNAAATPTSGAYSQQDMKVELGATGGAAACQMAADCASMNCTIAGAPVVIKKIGS